MENQKLVERLRAKAEEARSLRNGPFHISETISNLLYDAADSMENLQTENAALRRATDALTDAQAVMVKEFTEKLEELAQVKAERDAAVHDLHGECFACEHVDTDCPAMNCRNGEKFKWRGPQKEEKTT